STLVVAGGAGVDAAMRDGALLRRVQGASGAARGCCSVGSGAFVLAGAGALGGRRGGNPLRAAEALRRVFPRVQGHGDAVYLNDGEVCRSAGVTAGIDLCLSLVEADHGRALALRVAKRLVVHFKRPGGQRQFSAELLAQVAEEGLAARLTAWLRPRLQLRV